MHYPRESAKSEQKGEMIKRVRSKGIQHRIVPQPLRAGDLVVCSVIANRHMGAQFCGFALCDGNDWRRPVRRFDDIGRGIRADLPFFIYWRNICRPVATEADDDRMRSVERCFRLCSACRARVGLLESGLFGHARFVDFVAVLPTVRDEAV